MSSLISVSRRTDQMHLISELVATICKISSGIQANWSMANLTLFRLDDVLSKFQSHSMKDVHFWIGKAE